MIWHWILTVTGANNTSGTWYGFWSGFGSDLTEFVIFAGFIKLYRHHNCTIKGCPRIGHHPIDGTPYKTCHKHATPTCHAQLFRQHEQDFPEQHELLNRGTK